MAKGRLRARVRRPKPSKANRWRKGHSSSSNPVANKHRLSAKGKFASHLAQTHGTVPGSTLTTEALTTHDANQEDGSALDRDGDVEFIEPEEKEEEEGSRTLTSVATSTAYSLIETAHPVFGRVKRLWNSPLESHREICAVLAAVSEVVKVHEGKGTEAEYFGALMTALESADDGKSTTAIAYLLSIIIPKVPVEVLQSRCGSVCKVIVEKLSAHEQSDSTALLKSLMSCLTALLGAQDTSVWADEYTLKVFQLLLNYTLHPKPKLRKAAQSGVVSLLREGTATGGFHPSTTPTAKHCKHVIDKGGVETSTLHILVLLKECMANFTSQQIKTLCEAVLKLINLGNSVVRTTGLRALHGLFSSVAGPQGLTALLNGQLISALYDYQPSLVDSQMLQAWLTVMQSAHTRLSRLDQQLCLAHLPRLFSICVSCLLSNKLVVMETAATTMEVLLRECVEPYLETTNSDKRDSQLATIEKAFKSVEGGLRYKFFSSWSQVLRVLGTFYKVAGRQCHGFMSKSLVSLCELRSTADFPYTGELDSAFGVAVASMGPRVVLTAVPLQLDVESGSHDFPRSWMLPAMMGHIHHTELGYFTEALLPLAGRLRAKGQQCAQEGKLLESKLYETLEFQIWSLLPGFCTAPVDLLQSFRPLARLLGTALNERPDLRPIVCHALQLLIEGNRDNEENSTMLARFSKNYLPILFNLYTSPNPSSTSSSSSSNPPYAMDPAMAPLLECARAYASITEKQLLEGFFEKAMGKLRQEDLPTSTKCLVYDLVHTFVPHLSTQSLNGLFDFVSPRLDCANKLIQKKAYNVLEHILATNSSTHQAFRKKHLEQLKVTLLESLSTSHPAAKKPRLKCLVHLVDHLTPESAEFITAIVPEVILCTKEANEKVRRLSFKLLVSMGYAAQRCFRKSAEESVTDYFLMVLAGLAGSCHMISATILALARLVYEFYDLLGSELVKRLLCNTCMFLSSKRREVVMATLEFVKVTVGVLPANDLLPHVEELVSSVLRWSEKSGSHFRVKARAILLRVIRKFGYEMVSSMVPEKHRKLLIHIRKTAEREKRKRGEEKEGKADVEGETNGPKRRHIPSYEELLYESSEEEEEREGRMKKKKSSTRSKSLRASGKSKVHTTSGTWIREGDGEEPVNFLDPHVVKRVVATNPKNIGQKKALASPFATTHEGKLLITEEGEKGLILEQGRAAVEGMEVEGELEEGKQVKRKRKRQAVDDEDLTIGGGVGIHRRDPARNDFDYGAEYRAKKAKGDVKRPGKPDPFAYIPLVRQKLNRRKRAKLSGQFKGLMGKAKKGSALGTKQLHRRRK